MNKKRIIVASPHGFCSGVARAIETIDRALEKVSPPLYCFNQIVHNRQVVDDLKKRGVVFVTRIADVPDSATILFSAHGVSPAVRREAEAKSLRIIDATCPFVSKVHMEVKRFARQDTAILLIGHRNHEEIVGVAGEAPERVIVVEDEIEAGQVDVPTPDRVGVVTQTTLSVDAADRIIGVLRSRFPKLQAPAKSDICYATQNRQRAVQALAEISDLVLVLGSDNSSNSRRLVEVAKNSGTKASLLSSASDLDSLALSNVQTLGITSGASTPESFLEDILGLLSEQDFKTIETLRAAEENVSHFALPSELKSLDEPGPASGDPT